MWFIVPYLIFDKIRPRVTVRFSYQYGVQTPWFIQNLLFLASWLVPPVDQFVAWLTACWFLDAFSNKRENSVTLCLKNYRNVWSPLYRSPRAKYWNSRWKQIWVGCLIVLHVQNTCNIPKSTLLQSKFVVHAKCMQKIEKDFALSCKLDFDISMVELWILYGQMDFSFSYNVDLNTNLCTEWILIFRQTIVCHKLH